MPHGTLGGNDQTERTPDADRTASNIVLETRRTPQHSAAPPGAPAPPQYPAAGPLLPGAEPAPSSTMDSSPLPPKPHRPVGSTHSFNQTSARARRTAALTQASNAASLANTPVPVPTPATHTAFNSLAWPGAEGASGSLSRQWPDPQLFLTPADGSSQHPHQPPFPRQPTALGLQHSTSSSLGGRHSWSGSLSIMLGMLPSPSSTPHGPLSAMPAPSTSSAFDPLSPQPYPPAPSFPSLIPSWSSTGAVGHGPHAHATPRASATGGGASPSPFALAALDHSGASVSTTSATSSTTAHHRAAGSTSSTAAHGNHSGNLQPHASHTAALQSGGGGPQRKPSKDDWAPLPLPMALPPPARAAKVSLARVLAVSFWPAPLAALLFALALWVGGLGGWEVSLPGAQALFLMW